MCTGTLLGWVCFHGLQLCDTILVFPTQAGLSVLARTHDWDQAGIVVCVCVCGMRPPVHVNDKTVCQQFAD